MTETMAAVMFREPDFEVLPATLPGKIRTLLRRCLTKDVHQRLQAIGEARIAIEQTLAGNQDAVEVFAPAPVSRTSTLSWIVLAVALLIALVASALLRSPPPPPEVVRFEVEADLQGEAKIGVPVPVTPSFGSLELSGTVRNTRILDYKVQRHGSLLVSVPNTDSSDGATDAVHVWS